MAAVNFYGVFLGAAAAAGEASPHGCNTAAALIYMDTCKRLHVQKYFSILKCFIPISFITIFEP